jgi:hypothetical protein
LQATDKNSEDYQRLKGMQYIPTFVGLNVFTALSPINFGGCSLTVTQLGDGVSLTGRLSNGKELTVKMRNYPTFRADVEHGPDGRGSRTIHLFGTVTNKILDSRDKYESLIRVWINEDLSIKGMAFSLDRNERGAALDSRSCK